MRLETERLVLRELTNDDLAAWYAILSDAETMKHYPAPFDEEKVRQWLEWNLENYQNYGFGLWAVILKEENRLIGDCGMAMQCVHGKMLPEIGYHIAKAHQRRGYAKEAAQAVRDWTFAHTPFGMVYSYMKQSNLPSAAVARANGMTLLREYADAEQEQTAVYGISRTDWETRNMKHGT